MPNQAPLSPARLLYEELRENENAGTLDTWPAPHAANHQAAAATGHGGMDRIGIDRVEQIHADDGISVGDSIQPRSALAAIIRLQSTEIERLVLENDRLAVELSAVHQFHENEQNQRRSLERQLREANARNQPPAPAYDVEEIRRAARDGMSAEIKPVLVAILDLLESTLQRGAEAEKPAVVGGAPLSTPASLAAEVTNHYHRLPEILTRPLEELMSGNAGAAPVPPEQPRRPRPPRHEAQSSAMPSAFAWTSLFS